MAVSQGDPVRRNATGSPVVDGSPVVKARPLGIGGWGGSTPGNEVPKKRSSDEGYGVLPRRSSSGVINRGRRSGPRAVNQPGG
jgi:hypothetical protein